MNKTLQFPAVSQNEHHGETKEKTMDNTLLCGCGNKTKEGSFACTECLEELEYRYHLLQERGYYTIDGVKKESLEEFLQGFEEKGVSDCGTCAICGKRYTFMGHNPYPVIKDENSRCCSKCNEEIVMIARLGRLNMQ